MNTLATYDHISDLCYHTPHKMCHFEWTIVRQGHECIR